MVTYIGAEGRPRMATGYELTGVQMMHPSVWP